jgi:predicted RNA-binding Zn-ribbon protein involved in translation (DUF1610 family)
MRKYVCDMCGKEITTMLYRCRISRGLNLKSDDSKRYARRMVRKRDKHLCTKCKNKVLKVLKG